MRGTGGYMFITKDMLLKKKTETVIVRDNMGKLRGTYHYVKGELSDYKNGTPAVHEWTPSGDHRSFHYRRGKKLHI